MLRFEIGERVEPRLLVLGSGGGTVRYSSGRTRRNCRNCSSELRLDQLRRLRLRARLDVGDKLDQVPADLGGEAVKQAPARRENKRAIPTGVADGAGAALLVAARFER